MLNQLILGLAIGVTYSLVAIGLVMIYKVTKVMNFAFANIGMFFVYITLWIMQKYGLPLYISIIISLILSAIAGYLIERYGLRPIRNLSHASMLIITFGILMILEGLAIQLWGSDYKVFPEIVKGRPFIIRGNFGIVVFRKQDILVFSVYIAVLFFLYILMNFTKYGLAIKAVSQDEKMASCLGVNVGAVFAFSWIFGSAMATIVGILVAPKTFVHPGMLIFYQIEGFTAAVLGGFESFIGAALGGLILGVLENFVGNYISADLKMTFSLILIIVVLLFFPQGIFGNKIGRRA